MRLFSIFITPLLNIFKEFSDSHCLFYELVPEVKKEYDHTKFYLSKFAHFKEFNNTVYEVVNVQPHHPDVRLKLKRLHFCQAEGLE